MAEFRSPIGNRKIAGNRLREFDVPDGADEVPQFDVDRTISSGQLKKLDMDEIRQFQSKINSTNFESNIDYEEQAIKEAEYARNERQDRKKGIEKLSIGAKKRIEMLIGLTISTKDVDINGTIYTLQTLKSKERRAALIECSKYEHTVEFPFEARSQFLSRSLIRIGGLDIDQFLADGSFEVILEFVNELDDHLLARLWDEFNILQKDATDKYAINTAKEAEGVISDLKK